MDKESKSGDNQVPSTSHTNEIQDESKNQDEQPQLSPNTLKVAAAECLNSWIHYLQMLNSTCSAGLRLSQSIINLSLTQNISMATNCQSSWDELTKATMFATNSVKTHIAAAMQDMSIGDTFTETDAQRQQEHNQQIITENLLTFINLQYQFSIAACEYFGSMAMCPSCQTTPGGTHEPDCCMATLQQYFTRFYMQESRSQNSSPHYPLDQGSPKTQELQRQQHSPLNNEPRGSSPYQDVPRGSSPIHGLNERHPLETIRGPLPNPGQLHTMKSPFPGRGVRSPLHFPLFPISGQRSTLRRWSEAAAQEVVGESGDGTMRRWSMPWDCGRAEWQQKNIPPSKLTVPQSSSSQDRSRSTTPETPFTLGTISSGEGLAEAIQLLSCRPMRSSIPCHTGYGTYSHPWPETHEERMHRRMHPGPASQRGNWQSVDVPNTGMSVTEHYDIFPPSLPLTSRKSSSSTDSSSCLSIHSRSTTGSSAGSDAAGGDSIRLHGNLYSMWSASEHLPFIKLPESQEPQDDSDNDDPPTEKSGKIDIPKPT